MKTILFNGNKNIVHKQVRSARRALHLSQQELAAKMQLMGIAIDQQSVSKIENNARIVTDYEVMGLCKALKVSEEWLLGRTE